MVVLRRTNDVISVGNLDLEIIGPVLSAADLTSSTWWLAKDEGDIVGYCGAKAASTEASAIYLIRAGVLPEARGQGLQTRMIKSRLAWAKKKGYTSAITDTACDNIHSMRNLIAAGFVPYAPDFPWVSDGYIHWRKDW